VESYIWLIPVLPFAAFRRHPDLRQVVDQRVGPLAAHPGYGGVVRTLAGRVHPDPRVRGAGGGGVVALVSVGNFQVPMALQVDQLSAVMLLVVSGIGLLIFIYSVGYMHGDTGYYRFFAYMSLFAFSMLTLVLAGNYLLLYFAGRRLASAPITSSATSTTSPKRQPPARRPSSSTAWVTSASAWE